MAANEPTTAVIATFADRPQADRFVEELKQVGFRDAEIGVLTPAAEAAGTATEKGAAVGAAAGGAAGALAGAVLTGLIPGIGPVIAAGLWAGIFGGAAAGAAAGGLLGVLAGLGIPEEQARSYEREFQEGRTIVLVQAPGRSGEALAIFNRCRQAP